MAQTPHSDHRWPGPNVGGTITSGDRPERWKVTMSSQLEDGWSITGVCIYRNGRVRIRDVTLTPPNDSDTIADLKQALRRIRMTWVAQEWEWVLARSSWAELPPEWRSGVRESPRPGRSGHPPAFYAEWVERYLDACENHARPMNDLVADHPGVNASAIHRYLKRAEQLGLIADRPGRGRAGGTMTERCRRVLAGEEN